MGAGDSICCDLGQTRSYLFPLSAFLSLTFSTWICAHKENSNFLLCVFLSTQSVGSQFLSQEKDVVQISLDCLAGTDPYGVISPFLKNSIYIQCNSKKFCFEERAKYFDALLCHCECFMRDTLLGISNDLSLECSFWSGVHPVQLPGSASSATPDSTRCSSHGRQDRGLPMGVFGAAMGVLGAVGYPVCCPCTALLQCIIRAELKMAAGIWFGFSSCILYPWEAQRRAAANGAVIWVPGITAEKDTFLPLRLTLFHAQRTLRKPRNRHVGLELR